MSEIPSPTEIPVALLSQALLELREARGNSQATRQAAISYFKNGIASGYQIGPLLSWLISWPSKNKSVFSQAGYSGKEGIEFVEILRKLPVEELGLGVFAAVSTFCIGPEHLPVMHGVRESPSDNSDSGWRLASGRESPEFAADPKNYKLVPLRVMIDADQTLAPMQDWPVGTEVGRRQVTEPWRFVVDNDGKIGSPTG